MKGITMITIISKLENNLFDEILIKKGINNVNNLTLSNLLKNATFKTMCANGHIKVVKPAQKQEDKKTTSLNPEDMNYQELLKFVKEHQIETEGTKKANLLAAIKNYMKNERAEGESVSIPV